MDEQVELLTSQASKGAAAQEVWERWFKSFYDDHLEHLKSTFADLPLGDVGNMDIIHGQIFALDRLRSYLHDYIATGKMAEFDLNKGERSGN
jgi:hypothetical protein